MSTGLPMGVRVADATVRANHAFFRGFPESTNCRYYQELNLINAVVQCITTCNDRQINRSAPDYFIAALGNFGPFVLPDSHDLPRFPARSRNEKAAATRSCASGCTSGGPLNF